MRRSQTNPESGFALAALIFFLTAASILIAAAVPYYQMQAKRTQEDELIFRGEEYMRAIQKYQRKTGAYPLTLDALMDTNGFKFLRKEYLDPITGKPFRLIYINPDGTVTGSTLFNQRINNQPSPFGNTQQPGQAQPQSQQNIANNQLQQAAQRIQQQQQTQQTGAGTFKVGGGVSAPTQAGVGQQNPRTGQPGQQNAAGSTMPPSGTSGIIGVASDSEADSIKVYNGRQKYNEWEFVSLPSAPGQQGQSGQTGQRGQTGQQAPGQQQQQQRFGTGAGTPGFSSPTSPFGFGGQSQPQPQPQPTPIKRPPE